MSETSKKIIQPKGARRKEKKTDSLITEQIEAKIKKAKTRKAASKTAFKWYTEEIKNPRSNEINKWEGYLQPGKIYNFKYDAKLKDVLTYWDKNPVVLSLGRKQIKEGFLDIGINLNYLPLEYKTAIINQIIKEPKTEQIFNKNKSRTSLKKQPELPYLNYLWCVKFLSHVGFQFALRTYILNRRFTTKVFSYQKWDDVLLLDIADMEKMNLSDIRKLYKQFLTNKK